MFEQHEVRSGVWAMGVKRWGSLGRGRDKGNREGRGLVETGERVAGVITHRDAGWRGKIVGDRNGSPPRLSLPMNHMLRRK